MDGWMDGWFVRWQDIGVATNTLPLDRPMDLNSQVNVDLYNLFMKLGYCPPPPTPLATPQHTHTPIIIKAHAQPEYVCVAAQNGLYNQFNFTIHLLYHLTFTRRTNRAERQA